jgi:acyl dehydratase
VLELRDSRSRPNAGIVTFLHQGLNQAGQEVVTCRRQALMLRRPEAT